MEKYQSFADYQQAHENEANLNTIELLLVMHEPETLFRRMYPDHSCQKLYQEIVKQAPAVGIHVIEIR